MTPAARTHAQELTRIEQLIDAGKFKEALQLVETLDKREELTPVDRLTCHLHKSTLLNKLGHYEEGLKLAEAVFIESQRLQKRLHMFDALISMIEALKRLGRFYEGLKAIEQGENKLKSLAQDHPVEFPQRKASLLLQKGAICGQMGELDRALEYLQQSLAIFEQIGKKNLMAEALNSLGISYDYKGDWDRALEFWQQSLALREEIGNKNLMAEAINRLGKSYDYKGDWDRALEFWQQSLAMLKEIDYKLGIVGSLNNMGRICRQKGDFNEALAYLEQSLTLSEELSNDLHAAETLFQLISVSIDITSLDQARQYLHRLQQLNERTDNKVISQQYRVAEALVLKTSPRARQRGKAEELLMQVVEEEISEWTLTVEALLNLCDLLLAELSMTGNEDVMDEVQVLVTRLLEIANQQNLHWLLAESYFLKAKLALVELDIPHARQLLMQAQQIAEETGLRRLVIKISTEHDALLDQLSQWEELIERKASMSERFELARLEDLLVRMIRKRAEEIPEMPQEEPELVLIIGAESGISVFSKSFRIDRPLEEHLIEGFLTAINDYTRDAFAGTGAIERIKHQEYTLLLKAVEPFLVCYIFIGSSYLALQKLGKFTDALQENAVWLMLKDALKTGRILVGENGVDALVEEFFLASEE